MPGLPVVLINTLLPSVTTVFAPFNTRTHEYSLAKAFAISILEEETAATDSPISLAISPGCGVKTTGALESFNTSIFVKTEFIPSASRTTGTSDSFIIWFTITCVSSLLPIPQPIAILSAQSSSSIILLRAPMEKVCCLFSLIGRNTG